MIRPHPQYRAHVMRRAEGTMQAMDATFERIDYLMREQKRQNKELNNYLRMGKSTYDNWRKGASKSYYKHIDQIAVFLGVTPTYLITGPMGSTGSNIDDDSELKFVAEKELITVFRRLNKTKQDLLLKVAQEFDG